MRNLDLSQIPEGELRNKIDRVIYSSSEPVRNPGGDSSE